MKKILLRFFFSVILIVISISYSFGQTYSVKIVDESGSSIPYISFKSLMTNDYMLSDASGSLILNQEKINSADTLVVESILYKSMSLPINTLISQDTIVLTSSAYQIDQISVYPEDRIREIVIKLASEFSKKYSSDYAAQMLHLKTTEANGKYREFCGYMGIFASFDFTQSPPSISFLDKNSMGYWAPLTVMRSNPFLSDSDNVLEILAVSNSTETKWSKKALMIEYNDASSHNPLIYKRALELYSPLNPKRINNFTYRIIKEYENSSKEKIYVISFETKKESYPKKTLIYGAGHIYYNSTIGCPEEIIIENHQDQYSYFPRWKLDGLINSATKHTLVVKYCSVNSMIFTKSVSLKVNWVDPNVDERFYRIKTNSRRNPIKHNLREYEYIEFSDFISLNKDMKKQVKSLMYNQYLYLLAYLAPFEKNKWDNLQLIGIDRAKLFKDLNINGQSLYEQAEKNALDPTFHFRGSKSVGGYQNYYIRSREKIYPLLYNKKYE